MEENKLQLWFESDPVPLRSKKNWAEYLCPDVGEKVAKAQLSQDTSVISLESRVSSKNPEA